MVPLTSIHDIDLSPKPRKRYWRNGHREWREEFIYFLMVDRFHDDQPREPILTESRQSGFGSAGQLTTNCGGTIKGINDHLGYIKDLGCTAIWLSPVFKNNPTSYHGYAIENYLKIDERFGTKDDLEDLVNAAHNLNMRVFLDVVLHHSGDNWAYPFDQDYFYYNGATFPFGHWRCDDLPIPIELRNPELYFRKGQIRNYDAYPETREGDFQKLKTFKNDDTPESIYIQDILTKIHCYWVRETDVDGFRIDAVKHMGERAVSRFCSYMREYAYKLGKHNFFLFGELVGPDELYNRYIGPKTSIIKDDKAIYYGLNSVLDFPLYHVLPDVILGNSTPEKLIERYETLRANAFARGEFGEFLITFIDNHDQVGQPEKKRFGNRASEEQIIAAMGFLLAALGTPCIYYGTEQGFDGCGPHDAYIREAMFSLNDKTTNRLNTEGRIYKAIQEFSQLRRQYPVLVFGRMYIRKFSDDGQNFHWPVIKGCLLAFSRVLFDEEILIAFNSSTTNEDEEYVAVDAHINMAGTKFTYIYGHEGESIVLSDEAGIHLFIKLKLAPNQFVILSNVAKTSKDINHD